VNVWSGEMIRFLFKCVRVLVSSQDEDFPVAVASW